MMQTPIPGTGLGGRRLGVVPRPLEVWTLAALELLGAGASYAAAFVPATMHHFVFRGVLLGTMFAVTGIGLILLRHRLGQLGCVIGAIVGTAILSAAVALALAPQGAVLASLAFIWTTVYAASSFSRRYVYAVLAAIAAGSCAAFAANGIHRWVGVWVLVALTTTTTGLVLERSVGRLRLEAETDALTGLLNRRGFAKAAGLAWLLAARGGLAAVVVVIDLDNFKVINDRKGHAAGDALLISATAAWRDRLVPGDLIARFGGDEFVLFLTGPSADAVDEVLARCRAAHPIEWAPGVARLLEGESLEAAIMRADEQLYRAKLERRGSDLAR